MTERRRIPPRDRPSLTTLYDRWHLLERDDWDWRTPWHELIIERAAPFLRGAKVLEIGCGRGEFSTELSRRGVHELVAADVSQEALRLAEARIEAQGSRVCVTLQQQDIQDLAFEDHRFDVVVTAETIEHVPDPRRAISELFRVLRPGGHIFLTTPNYLSITGAHRAWVRLSGRRYTEGGQPWNNLTMVPRTYLWMRQAGFDIERIGGTGHYLPIPRRAPHRLRLSPSAEHVLRLFATHSLFVGIRPT